ncbi:MAG: radical SAM protein [Halioglobus sp.]
MQRPVWLLSMDSDEFQAPPTTTAALCAYYRQYGALSESTDIELVHFQQSQEIDPWLGQWKSQWHEHSQENTSNTADSLGSLAQAPIIGFSFYTWNAAEFLELARDIKNIAPEVLIIAGGPHVQQAQDYLGTECIDVIFLGEAEVTFQEFLDCSNAQDWKNIAGLSYLNEGEIVETTTRDRCKDLDTFPSPLDVLTLTDQQGEPLYTSIAYETSRGCPFKCAFCEWGTGAIGTKMYQWSMDRIRSDWEKIVAAGIKDIWLADSNFGALKQDIDKAKLLVELKEETGLPVSFATSWSKKHSRQVQEIALLLHGHQLLPHYQLALQTLTPEALRLSHRQNMSSNEYEPIAKSMSEQGVPIAAELIWGLPGDNLADFEKNLDELLCVFPNINIFGYTLLPGTEFYRRRDEYQIQAIPVAGYGKAKGEYVVGCHTFDRAEGEEGYFLISAHILLVHGHIMPLTTRLLALHGATAVSELFREILRELTKQLGASLPALDINDRMSVYEQRDQLYLAAIANEQLVYHEIARILERRLAEDPLVLHDALRTLKLDQALCPRAGNEHEFTEVFDFDAQSVYDSLSAMELPDLTESTLHSFEVQIRQPGGVGDILTVADGGSWLRGVILSATKINGSIQNDDDQRLIAIA